MNPAVLDRVINVMEKVYLKDGLDELNKRVGVLFNGNLDNFKRFESTFKEHMDAKYSTIDATN